MIYLIYHSELLNETLINYLTGLLSLHKFKFQFSYKLVENFLFLEEFFKTLNSGIYFLNNL